MQSLTTLRADHRCIFSVGAKGTDTGATVQATLSSTAGPDPTPLPTRSLTKGCSTDCQYGISIAQLPTDHLCFFDVPGVVTDSLPLTTAVDFHTAFILVYVINKTNARGDSHYGRNCRQTPDANSTIMAITMSNTHYFLQLHCCTIDSREHLWFHHHIGT